MGKICDKIFFALSIYVRICFSPIPHLSPGCSQSFVHLFSLLSPILHQSDFVKLFAMARKTLGCFRKLSRRSMMTRPCRECRYKRLSKGKGRETEGKIVAPAGDQRILKAKASITDITAKAENDWRESVRKLSHAHDVSTKTVHATLHFTLLQLSKKLAS
jgi:hypothetical protein